MTAPLQQIADIITRAAGWKQAFPGEDGAFHFELEGGLDFSLLSPENRTGIFLAPLGNVPDSDEDIRRLAALAAGSLKKRRSVFSLGEHGLELHRSFLLSDASETVIVPELRDFLNDLAWWKHQISGAGSSSSQPASPFSFTFGNWFPG